MKRRNLFMVLFLSFCVLQSIAQEKPKKEYSIRYKHSSFTPQQHYSKPQPANAQSRSAKTFETAIAPGYYLVQFLDIPSMQDKDALKQAGVTLFSYVPNFAYEAHLESTVKTEDFLNYGIRAIEKIPAGAKLSSELHFNKIPEVAQKSQGKIEVLVSFYANMQIEEGLKSLETKGYKAYTSEKGQAVYILTPRQIQKLAEIDFVRRISTQMPASQPFNDEARTSIKANVLSRPLPGSLGLSGQGVHIGVGDAGMLVNHLDYQNRYTLLDSIATDDHSIHVSGTIAGNGNKDQLYAGIAPKAEIYNAEFEAIIENAVGNFETHGITITNNSYGVYCSNGDAGYYTTESENADRDVVLLDKVLHVVSAGNDADKNCSGSINGFGSVSRNLQSAKNSLAVGALHKEDEIMPFSSKGPVRDGRLKPEICAVGGSVKSCFYGNGYQLMSGTSMSAPGVTGAMALLYERYKQLHNDANPKSALIKAVACNTADDLGNPGPDYTFGFGRLNAVKAVKAIENESYVVSTISNGGAQPINITVPAGASEAKIMLYWNDKAGNPNATSALVNDLDLYVTSNGKNYRPWILDPSVANAHLHATRGADHINNIEQTSFAVTGGETIDIVVFGYMVPEGPQEFVVTYEFSGPELGITYPNTGDVILAGNATQIRWESFETDNASLEYSIDNGMNWITLATDIPSSQTFFRWEVPQTVTNNALLRISDGTMSNTTAPFAIMGRPSLTARNVCEGTMELVWLPESNTASYNIYLLSPDDVEWQLIGNTDKCYFHIADEDAQPENWVSIAAVSPLGIEGIRSIAKPLDQAEDIVNYFPFIESFENGKASWTIKGQQPSWFVGSPGGVIINSAARGNNAIVTGLNGYHNPNEVSYLVSPCINISNVTDNIYVSFDQFLDIASNDQALYVDYSLDGGDHWSRLGSTNDDEGWYNQHSQLSGEAWTNTATQGWRTVSHIMYNGQLNSASTIRFRIGFECQNSTLSEGVAIDNIRIGTSNPLADICLNKQSISASYPSLTFLPLNDAIQTDDGGFIASGNEDISGYTTSAIYKSNSQGEIEWAKSYYDTYSSASSSKLIRQLSDGFATTGGIKRGQNESPSVMRIKGNGDYMWAYKLHQQSTGGNSGRNEAIWDMIVNNEDESVAITGISFNSTRRMFITKFAADGTIDWSNQYSITPYNAGTDEWGIGLYQKQNGNYILAGNNNAGSLHFIELDAEGTVVSAHSTQTNLVFSSYVSGRSKTAFLNDNEFIVYVNGHIMHFGNNFEMNWHKTIDPSYTQICINNNNTFALAKSNGDLVSILTVSNTGEIISAKEYTINGIETISNIESTCSGYIISSSSNYSGRIVKINTSLPNCFSENDINISVQSEAVFPTLAETCTINEFTAISEFEFIDKDFSQTATIDCMYSEPDAVFTSSESFPCVGETVVYTNISTRPYETIEWNFGEGATPATANTAGPHEVVYSSSGSKTVNMSFDGGASSENNHIQVVNLPSASISGPTTVDSGEAVNFTTSYSPFYDYFWSVPADAEIIAGEGSSTINVAFGSEGGNVVLTVVDNYRGSCASEPAEFAVDIASAGSVGISGTDVVCKTDASENWHVLNYTISNANASASYIWSVSEGTIVNGQGTPSIDVQFPAGTGTVTISTEEQLQGQVVNSGSITVAMNIRPSAPGAISGKSGYGTVCFYETEVEYTVTGGGPEYLWEVISDATLTDGQGSNTITVDFGSEQGNITVYSQNGDGCYSHSNVSLWVGPIDCGLKSDAVRAAKSEIDCVQSSELRLTPQPANTYVEISTDRVVSKIKLYNSIGTLVASYPASNMLDISNLISGSYSIQIELENGQIVTEQLLVQ